MKFTQPVSRQADGSLRPLDPIATDPTRRRIPTYYERLQLPVAHDAILRCGDCRRLVLHASLATTGVTPCCGTRKVLEVRHLRFWEWLRIRLGLLDFPYRKDFLAEFSRVR